MGGISTTVCAYEALKVPQGDGISPRGNKGATYIYLQGLLKLPASAIYSALFIHFFRGIHRQLSAPFEWYLLPGDYVCIMCHQSTIFLSNDPLLHSDSKTYRWANHQTGEIHPQSHDRDLQKPTLSYLILNHHCQSIQVSNPNLPGTWSTTSLDPLLGHFSLCLQQCHRTSTCAWKRGGGADGTQGPSTYGRTTAGLAPGGRGC